MIAERIKLKFRKMNYSNIKYFSTANGAGVRTAVFVSGCDLHCPGCFNPETWDFNHGTKFTDETINKILDSIEPVYISGLSILGGEPLNPKNCNDVYKLVKEFRKRFGYEKTIWIWSGYTLGSMDELQKEIVFDCDVLVDGPFVLAKKNLKIPYRGSTNQRVWDIIHPGEVLESAGKCGGTVSINMFPYAKLRMGEE